jgi:hypothetical protein
VPLKPGHWHCRCAGPPLHTPETWALEWERFLETHPDCPEDEEQWVACWDCDTLSPEFFDEQVRRLQAGEPCDFNTETTYKPGFKMYHERDE